MKIFVSDNRVYAEIVAEASIGKRLKYRGTRVYFESYNQDGFSTVTATQELSQQAA